LLDEPLASLDAARKETVLPYLRRLREELQIPMLYVSHALPEIVALCDDLAVIEGGRLLQYGSVEDVLRRPASAEVARLVGVETVVRARVESMADGLVGLALGAAHLSALAPELPATTKDVLATIRAEDVILLRESGPLQTSARNRLAATVQAIVPAGATIRIELDCGFPLVALLTRQAVDELALAPGKSVHALIKAPHVHVIPVG
jgi:molybdate transport system ATP-binding protein